MNNTLQDSSRKIAIEIVGNLPKPIYEINFQPTYPNNLELIDAVHELLNTKPVTTFEQIDSLQNRLSSEALMVIFGSCHEPVRLTQNLEELETPIIDGLDLLASSALAHAIAIHRGRGQSTKPRTSGMQTLSSGLVIPSFQGEMVNGQNINDRQADPSRMVASAVQSRDIETALNILLGKHIPSAHEALLLPYERSFIKTNPKNGKKYLLSTDLPWIGVRTINPKNEHVQLLSNLENSVGGKIGADSNEQHIQQLTEILNPERKPGKLILMLRVGLDNMICLREIVKAIRKHSENSLIVYDMHGITYTHENGMKIRNVQDIKKEITQGQEVLNQEGLRWNGLHLETTNDPSRLECIDDFGQLPTHEGDIDPRLNPQQAREIYNYFAKLQ